MNSHAISIPFIETASDVTGQPSDRPSRRHIVALVVGFGALYSLTAEWGFDANVDAIAAALPAWSVGTEGTLYLDDFARANPWMVEGPEGWASNRPPGVIAIAVPAYAFTQTGAFSNMPATATAISATVAAVVLLYVTLSRLVGPRVALVASGVFGAGTSTWQISADALWPHGPGQLWAALGLLGLSGAAFTGAGMAFGMALLTRPITAVSTAVVGIWEAWLRRSARPVLALGIPAAGALAILAFYNRIVFGNFSISGGYPQDFVDRLATESTGSHVGRFVGFFIAPENGIFVWSPITLLGVIGMIAIWRTLPSWTRSTALAALVYIVVHARLNRVSGGTPFGYRYPLEALMLVAPALTLGAVALWTRGGWWQRAVFFAAGLSVVLQAALVFLLQCEPGLAGDATCSFVTLRGG